MILSHSSRVIHMICNIGYSVKCGKDDIFKFVKVRAIISSMCCISLSSEVYQWSSLVQLFLQIFLSSLCTAFYIRSKKNYCICTLMLFNILCDIYKHYPWLFHYIETTVHYFSLQFGCFELAEQTWLLKVKTIYQDIFSIGLVPNCARTILQPGMTVKVNFWKMR